MAKTGETDIHTGGCQCGSIRYALRGPLTACSLCHCRMCQKAAGGAFMALVAISTAVFTWTRGEPGYYASSTRAKRGFCRDCGTPLTYQAKPERIEVTYGSLDDPGTLAPNRRLSSETVMPWCEQVGRLPIASVADWLATIGPDAAITPFQHPDHD